jgi:hypothetical protein
MEEIVSQIEREFEDLETTLRKTPDNTPTSTPTKSFRLSIRTRLRKGDDIANSLEEHLSNLSTSQRNVVESRLSGKWIKYVHTLLLLLVPPILHVVKGLCDLGK